MLSPGALFYSSTISGLPRSEEMLASVDLRTRTNRSGTRYFGRPGSILGEFRRAGFSLAAYQIVREPYVLDNLIVYARKGKE